MLMCGKVLQENFVDLILIALKDLVGGKMQLNPAVNTDQQSRKQAPLRKSLFDYRFLSVQDNLSIKLSKLHLF